VESPHHAAFSRPKRPLCSSQVYVRNHKRHPSTRLALASMNLDLTTRSSAYFLCCAADVCRAVSGVPDPRPWY
jgi:hypothetical protein